MRSDRPFPTPISRYCLVATVADPLAGFTLETAISKAEWVSSSPLWREVNPQFQRGASLNRSVDRLVKQMIDQGKIDKGQYRRPAFPL